MHNNNLQQNANRVLHDCNKNGKDRNWRARKLSNIEYAQRLETLGYQAFARVYQCAEVLAFAKNADGTLKLRQTWFCKHKLCPICNWRKSMKYSAQIAEIVDEAMLREPKNKFIFLTLTIKNCNGNELRDTLTHLTASFDRLFRRAKIKKVVRGWIRSVEVTHNAQTNTYHPHVHILIMVTPSYFTRDYIKQSEWTDMWAQSAKLDYRPIVDVRRIKSNKSTPNKSEVRKAVLETAKYPTKPIDADRNLTDEQKLRVTDDLLKALDRKRQIGFGGLFKEIRQEFAQDDVESGDLVHIDDDANDSTAGQELIARWNWERKNYYIE